MPRVVLCARRRFEDRPGGIERWSDVVRDCLTAGFDVDDRANRGLPGPLYLAAMAARLPRLAGDVVDASDASLAWPAARSRRPVVMRVHGLDLLYRNPVYQTLLRRGLSRIDRVVANSHATADLARRSGVEGERLHVIHPPASPPDGPVVQEAVPGRILLVGRLAPRKGAARFVEEVWPLVVEDRADATLVVAGDGPDRRRLTRAVAAAEGDAQWVGALRPEAVESAFASAAVHVMNNQHLPHDFEGFGIVAAEAAMRGVPTVARAVDGIPDAVVDGVTGTLVQGTDPRSMADAVVAALDRSWDGDRMRAEAERRWGVERHCREYTAVVESVL